MSSASAFEARDPRFEEKIRESFEKQRIMSLIGASLLRIEPGLVEIELPFRADLVQQHGFIHAGVISTIADSAGGYAAYSLMPEGTSVLSVEYKLNLVRPAAGERFVGVGRVKRAGKQITVCEIEAMAVSNGTARCCATGLQTIMCIRDADGGPTETK